MSKPIAIVTHVCDYAGPAAVNALTQSGFTVIAHDPSFTDEKKRSRYLKNLPGVIPVEFQEPEQLVRHVVQEYRQIDALVSNDTFPAIHCSLESADISDLTDTLDKIIVFPFRLMKEAVPVFKNQRLGRVIMITSCRTELPLQGGAIPDIARDGANALVKSLSLELAPYQVPVNAVAPNYLYSEAYFPKAKFIDNPEGRRFIETVVPAGRLGKADELGELITYLARMKGSFHTGTIIKFAGGWPSAPRRPV